MGTGRNIERYRIISITVAILASPSVAQRFGVVDHVAIIHTTMHSRLDRTFDTSSVENNVGNPLRRSVNAWWKLAGRVALGCLRRLLYYLAARQAV